MVWYTLRLPTKGKGTIVEHLCMLTCLSLLAGCRGRRKPRLHVEKAAATLCCLGLGRTVAVT